MNALVQEYDPALEADYGINQRSWQLLCTQIFPNAKSSYSIVNALEYCRTSGLDVFAKTVNIVNQYDSESRSIIETVWPSFQSLLQRANGEFSRSAPEYGPNKTETFHGSWHEPESGTWVGKCETVTVTFPEYVRLTITTFDGERRLEHPIHLYWMETYATIWSSPVPTEPWRKRPRAQLEKCAIAAGLREAFPATTGYCAEEMAGRSVSPNSISQNQPMNSVQPSFPSETSERIRKAFLVHHEQGTDRNVAVARSLSRYENIPGHREEIERLANDVFGLEATDV